MSFAGTLVTVTIACFGIYLYLSMVAENRRTRPERVRRRLEKLGVFRLEDANNDAAPAKEG